MNTISKITCTIPEATAISGLGRTFIYGLFSQGKLRKLKAGKRTLIMVSDLQAYLESLNMGDSSHAA